MDQRPEQRFEQSNPSYIRWIPIVVPLCALLIVLGVYLVGAEVLVSRLMP
jgi:hypothetical protein